MKIEILDAAQDDLRSGYLFYEQQAEGIGLYFLDTLFSDIDSWHLYAGMHPISFDRYHRLLSTRFPFAAYYTAEGNVVRIYAVLDCRQNPSEIENRLSR